jgi:hypothetical protein
MSKLTYNWVIIIVIENAKYLFWILYLPYCKIFILRDTKVVICIIWLRISGLNLYLKLDNT